MTNTIDWNAPLEAHHPDGRVVEVELIEGENDGDMYGVDGIGVLNAFHVDGRAYSSDWCIRNRKPAPQYPAELVERAITLLRCAAEGQNITQNARQLCEELPQPVDPDFTALYEAINELPDSNDILANLELNVTDIIAALKRKGFAITRC